MTKKEIALSLNKNLNFSYKNSLRFIDSFINLVKSNSKNRQIKIHDFGTFYLHKSPKRVGRNPKTKESYIIPPRSKLAFKASKKIRDFIN